jgi:WD40 repeat protein
MNEQDFGAHVIAAAFDRGGDHCAFALGDGTLRMSSAASPDEWRTVEAHDGAVLSLAQDVGPTGFITGGDDGRLLRVGADGAVARLADFGGKWVEHVSSYSDSRAAFIACSAGKVAYVIDRDGGKLKSLAHPSTVTGLAIDAKGKRLAASHYNGATVWFVTAKTDTPKFWEWKGSHTAVALHPAGEALVTAMQENALHGWHLPDGHHMRMSGYPAKAESIGFTRNGRWLASSGADAIVLWPFFGGGPMGKPPLELAQIEGVLCTRCAVHPAGDVVAAGYANGTVLIADINTQTTRPLSAPGAGAISALAWNAGGSVLVWGTEHGVVGRSR